MSQAVTAETSASDEMPEGSPHSILSGETKSRTVRLPSPSESLTNEFVDPIGSKFNPLDLLASKPYGGLGIPLAESDDSDVFQNSAGQSQSGQPLNKDFRARTITQQMSDARHEFKREKTLPPLAPYVTHAVLDKLRPRKRDWRPQTKSVQEWATIVPLISAVLAPISTLFDIPGVTQNWYTYYGETAPDFAASLALSGTGLALNIIGNALLILRFSDVSWWHICAQLSNFFWVAKTIIALVNVSLYGAASRNEAGYSYDEGFWCAVVSVILTGFISIILTFHGLVEWLAPSTPENDTEDAEDIRLTGRQFMLSVTVMDLLLALEALIFSKIEGWTFLEGLYFSVVTGFTIGLGDYHPTVTSTKVLLFFFAVATITYLANQVTMIVGFISDRGQKRKRKWRQRFEQAQQKELDKRELNLNLAAEMVFLEHLANREELLSQMYDLFMSGLALTALLLISSVIFSEIEGWTYGNALYFTYVVLLTIGYGDLYPTTAGGKVFFIVFALSAVPIVTSFAVQTVSGLLAAVANHRLEKKQASIEQDKHHEAFTPHETWVSEQSQLVDRRLQVAVKNAGGDDLASLADDHDFQEHVTRQMSMAVLDLAIKLEMQARMLMIGQMKANSREQTLLRADLHVQTKIREHVWRTRGSEKSDDDMTEDEREFRQRHPLETYQVWDTMPGAHCPDTLAQVRDYRKTFAQLLAVGSKLLKLEGYERYHFERRLMSAQEEAIDAVESVHLHEKHSA